jgi:hypothetical protein
MSCDILIPFSNHHSVGTCREAMAVVCCNSGGRAARFTWARKSKGVQKRYNGFAIRRALAKAY